MNRFVYLGDPAKEALNDYLTARNIKLSWLTKKQGEWPLFATRENNHMGNSTLASIIYELGKKRVGAKITPHMIRHTFATEMLRACGCLRSVQLLMGHSPIESTERYCHLDANDRTFAIDNYHPLSEKTKQS